jgi:hypothetical protein
MPAVNETMRPKFGSLRSAPAGGGPMATTSISAPLPSSGQIRTSSSGAAAAKALRQTSAPPKVGVIRRAISRCLRSCLRLVQDYSVRYLMQYDEVIE